MYKGETNNAVYTIVYTECYSGPTLGGESVKKQ